RNKPVLTSDEVLAIASAAREHAEAHSWAVSIAIVDDGGHLLNLHRLDTAAISVEIATGKARTAALGRRESKSYEQIVGQGRVAFLSVPSVTALEGGVPIIVEGQVIGAVGVSGVRSEQDAEIARAGIAALGLPEKA
ncbi:MAG: GlcG/HbpS family heme-binding protein, partial [Janthinobacterium lividum]